MKGDVVVIGDALMDYQYDVESMPQVGQDTRIVASSRNPGGSGANSAIALSYLNVSCAFCGIIGRDETGKEMLRQMESVGLDTACMQFGSETGYTLTFIDKNGERTMFSYRGCAGEPFELSSGLISYLKNAKLLLLSGYLLANKNQAEFALKAALTVKQAGGLVALDASPNIALVDKEVRDRMLSLTDILLPNKGELQFMAGTDDVQQALNLLITGTPCIAAKLGSKGSAMMIREGFKTFGGSMFSESMQFSAPAVGVVPVDTTGAGDAFNAGFIRSFLKDENPMRWLESGNLLASKVIMKKGAVSVYVNSID
ncbi:MAG: carbohydrate kinase family protein [Eubacteriales bacterium]|nr:carbohydrate kinase family protein [Eubacteriales bacterium]